LRGFQEGANISEFWTLAGKSIAINPPVSDAEAEFLDTLDIIGLSLEGFNASCEVPRLPQPVCFLNS
jgi:hypothetical protein